MRNAKEQTCKNVRSFQFQSNLKTNKQLPLALENGKLHEKSCNSHICPV